jgi:hypothetical protein
MGAKSASSTPMRPPNQTLRVSADLKEQPRRPLRPGLRGQRDDDDRDHDDQHHAHDCRRPDGPADDGAAPPQPRAGDRPGRRRRSSPRSARRRPPSPAASAPRSSPACSACGSTILRRGPSSSAATRPPARRLGALGGVILTRPARRQLVDRRGVRAWPPTSRSCRSTTGSVDPQGRVLEDRMPYIWGGTSDNTETDFGGRRAAATPLGLRVARLQAPELSLRGSPARRSAPDDVHDECRGPALEADRFQCFSPQTSSPLARVPRLRDRRSSTRRFMSATAVHPVV